MKSLIMVSLIMLAVSCKDAATTSKESMKDTGTTSTMSSSTTAAVNYPYSIEHPDNWEMGSSTNTSVALNALRAWEMGKMDESVSFFADSARMQFDALDRKMSRDSIKALFVSAWGRYKNVHIKMNDWESVISKDKSEEWVTVWYTQSWVDNKGAADSVALINDIMLKDGKITRLDEYTRKLH